MDEYFREYHPGQHANGRLGVTVDVVVATLRIRNHARVGEGASASVAVASESASG
jgi:hypothetical protein